MKSIQYDPCIRLFATAKNTTSQAKEDTKKRGLLCLMVLIQGCGEVFRDAIIESRRKKMGNVYKYIFQFVSLLCLLFTVCEDVYALSTHAVASANGKMIGVFL